MDKAPLFKISVKPRKLFYITFALVYLFIILCECEILPFSRKGYSLISLFFILASLVRFEFSENPFWDIFIPLGNATILTIVFQIMLSADPAWLNMPTRVGNVMFNAGITYLFLLITNRIRLAVTLSNTFLFGFAFIDYLVISFRGSEIKFSDIYSLRTAASVAGQYKIEFTSRLNYSIFVFVAILFLLWVTKITNKSKKNQLPRITALLFIGISAYTVSWCMNNSTNYMQVWGTEGIKYNGLTYNFLIEARDSRVAPPEGYTKDKAEKLLAQYKSTETEEDSPNIIVIMSEAFADLSVLGEFNVSEDPLEFYNSLSENCIKGYAMSSIYGGNTATSEWEFLTGNTQAFMPYGSVAYQQYIKKSANSIVDIMNDNGYTTVAMHPYLSTGWRRNVVYDVFGFDEIYFEDELSKENRIRGFISDSTLFKDIANRFENKKADEKLFTFAITMQNHGGYEFGGFPSEVTVDGIDLLSVNQYLTLLNKSDDALRELITFFENYEEDTMIVIFGDHFPAINSQFYSHVMGDRVNTYEGTMAQYTIPYMIWTNYESESGEGELTSINFLSTIMMKKAGIGLTPYFSYLDELYGKMPAVSFFAYASAEKGGLKRPSEATGAELELINEYKTIQYYNMFE